MSRWGRVGLLCVLVLVLASSPAIAQVDSPSENEKIPFNAQPITIHGTVPYYLEGFAVDVNIIGEVGNFCEGTVVVTEHWSCTLPLTVHLAPGVQTFEVMEEGGDPPEILRNITIGDSALAITTAEFTSPTTLVVHGIRDATGSSGVPYNVQASILLPFSDNAHDTTLCESVGVDGFTCTYEFAIAHPAGTETDVTISEIWAERTVGTLDPWPLAFGAVDDPPAVDPPTDPPSGNRPPTGGSVGSSPVVPIPLAPPAPTPPPAAAPTTPAPAPTLVPEVPESADSTDTQKALSPVKVHADSDVLRLLLLMVLAFVLLAMIGPHGLAYASDPGRRQRGRPGSLLGGRHLGDDADGLPDPTDQSAALTLAALAAAGDTSSGDGSHDGRRYGISWGDRSWTWQLPGWQRADRISLHAPIALARRFPLVARIGADATYLRAALGTVWLALPLLGLVLGVSAAVSSDGLPLAPSTLITATLLVIAILDATSGAVAVLGFTAVVLVRGGLTADGLDLLDGIRGLLGLAALWFAIPLVAAAARPFRRLAQNGHVYGWDRLGDAVIAALIGGWAVEGTVSGLSDLVGRHVEVSEHAGRLALLAIGVLLARVVVEEAVAAGYPARLRAVQHTEAFPEPTRMHRLRGILVRGALVALFAHAVLGNCWQLWAGVALYAVPQVLTLVEDSLPNIPQLHSRLPRGIVEVLVMLVVGVLLARIIDSTYDDEPTRALRDGFLLLAMPGCVFTLLGILGRESPAPPWTWPRQLAGAVIVVITVVLVLTLT